jgi:hypothetical protein
MSISTLRISLVHLVYTLYMHQLKTKENLISVQINTIDAKAESSAGLYGSVISRVGNNCSTASSNGIFPGAA